MRATGIVRRVDDLGRVVIPKEIRRTLRIKDGDPLEIYTDKDTVCFKRYIPIDNDKLKLVYKTLKHILCKGLMIEDRDNEAVSGLLNIQPINIYRSVITNEYGDTVGYICTPFSEYTEEQLAVALKIAKEIVSED